MLAPLFYRLVLIIAGFVALTVPYSYAQAGLCTHAPPLASRYVDTSHEHLESDFSVVCSTFFSGYSHIPILRIGTGGQEEPWARISLAAFAARSLCARTLDFTPCAEQCFLGVLWCSTAQGVISHFFETVILSSRVRSCLLPAAPAPAKNETFPRPLSPYAVNTVCAWMRASLG